MKDIKMNLYFIFVALGLMLLFILFLSWVEPTAVGYCKIFAGMCVGMLVAGPLSYYLTEYKRVKKH